MNLHQHDDENTAIFNQPKKRGRKAGFSLVGDQLENAKRYRSMRVIEQGYERNPRREKRETQAQRATQTTRWPQGPCSAAVLAVNQDLGLVQGKPKTKQGDPAAAFLRLRQAPSSRA